MEIKTINEKELKLITGQMPIYKDIIDIDQTNFDTLLNSGIINLDQLIKLDAEMIDHLKYINKYLKVLDIKKIYTRFILEDLRSMILNPEFDIVVYLNTIMAIQRFKHVFKIIKEESNLDDRTRLYTKIECCSHSREIESMLGNMDKVLTR